MAHHDLKTTLRSTPRLRTLALLMSNQENANSPSDLVLLAHLFDHAALHVGYLPRLKAVALAVACSQKGRVQGVRCPKTLKILDGDIVVSAFQLLVFLLSHR